MKQQQYEEAVLLFLKGLLMGIADIIPGVSGGTIAFITNIYDRFIQSLSDLSTAGKHFLRGRWEEGWRTIDFSLLIPLTTGITIAFVLGSLIIPWLMNVYPTYVLSFFVGLVLVSAYLVYEHIREHTLPVIVAGVIGLLLGVLVALAPQFSTPGTPLFIFVLGFLSISAMLLPGISGSYILLMFGQYKYILASLFTLNWPVLISFKIGAVIGLLTFSRLLSWLLKRYHSMTFSALTGVMIGALYRPWRDAMSHAKPGMIPLTILSLLTGVGVVLLLQYLSRRKT